MTLAELRATVLDYLDISSEEDAFSVGLLDRLINTAYLNVVGKVEMAAPYYNVSETVPTLTVPSSPPREYDLGTAENGLANPATDIRKILDCTKRATGASDPPYSLRIVDFAKRNAWLGRTSLSNPVPQSAVYFYRTFAGTWFLGFIDLSPPVGAVLEVRYLPDIVVLDTDTDVPLFVPLAWHYVIALKAAFIGKGKENRNAESNLVMYTEALADMQRALSSAVNLPQVQVV
jgi:hypothetical protein